MRSQIHKTTVIVLMLAASAGCTQDAGLDDKERIPFVLDYPNLDDPDGEILLDNEHVVVQRYIVPPDTWEGVHAHPGNQLYVHVVGGTWSGLAGDEPTFTDSVSETGEMGWMPRIPLSEGHQSGNTGTTPIDLIWVTLKGDGPIRPDVDVQPQHYPEIPMETLVDNERVIVQRVQVEPGQWEGVHSHPGNQVFVHIKGGTWAGKMGGVLNESTTTRPDGHVGWLDAIDISEEHESGNVGDTTIDLVWITLR